jgi:hypothetical protein
VNSIHSIRLLQVAHESLKSNQAVNYFNCDSSTFSKITQFCPVFTAISENIKLVVEFLGDLKLDMVELALFSAYLAFSISCRGLVDSVRYFEANRCVWKALANYMFARRNERESAEQLIGIQVHFERMNIRLTRGIYSKFSEIRNRGGHISGYYESNLLGFYDN